MKLRGVGVLVAWLGAVLLLLLLVGACRPLTRKPLPAHWDPGAPEFDAEWTVVGVAATPWSYTALHNIDDRRWGTVLWFLPAAGVPLYGEGIPSGLDPVYVNDRLVRASAPTDIAKSSQFTGMQITGVTILSDAVIVALQGVKATSNEYTLVVLDPRTLTERTRMHYTHTIPTGLKIAEETATLTQVSETRCALLIARSLDDTAQTTELSCLRYAYPATQFEPLRELGRTRLNGVIGVPASEFGAQSEELWSARKSGVERPDHVLRSPRLQGVSTPPSGMRCEVDGFSIAHHDGIALGLEWIVPEFKPSILSKLASAWPQIRSVIPAGAAAQTPPARIFGFDRRNQQPGEVLCWDAKDDSVAMVESDLARVVEHNLGVTETEFVIEEMYGTYALDSEISPRLITQMVYSPPQGLTQERALLRLGVLDPSAGTVKWLGWTAIPDFPANTVCDPPYLWSDPASGDWILALEGFTIPPAAGPPTDEDWLAWCRFPNPIP